MISLIVDECYAFDYLCILEIKKNINKDSNFDSWIECYDNIKSQIPDKFEEIINSIEYEALYKANLLTFNAVERARTGKEITAKEVDDCNMERYYAKINLQKTFFSDSIVREKKL